MVPARMPAMAAAAALHLGAAVLVLLTPAGEAVPPAGPPALRLFDVAAVPEPAPAAPAAAARALPEAVPTLLPQAAPARPAVAPAAAPVAVAAAAGEAAPAAVPVAVGADAAPERASVRDLYTRQLWQHILAWKPPGATVAGTAVVQFAVDRGGALQHLALAQSSGSARLDRIALRSVRLAAPMPRPPAELGDDDLSFSLAFSFG